MDFSNAERGIEKKKIDPIEKYMNDPRIQRKFKSFMAGNETELYSAEGLPAIGRKAWHELAQTYGLYSTSAGEGACRHVIVSKRPFHVGGNPLILSATAQQRFRDDFGLKINCCDYNDFEYYVNLYGAQPQLQLTLNAIAEFSLGVNQQEAELAWMTYLIEIKKKIWAHIKSSAGYKRFIAADLTPLANKTREYKAQLQLGDKYLDSKNYHKMYVSIDIKSANYNAFRWYDPDIFNIDGNPTSSWGEFVGSFAKDRPATAEYLKASKLFRQKIFWEFDHHKQKILWEYLIVHQAWLANGKFIQGYHISDEVVFEINELSAKEWWLEYAKSLSHNSNIFRVKIFRLYNVSKDKPWIVLKYLDGTSAIKCCNPTEHAIIWKRINDIPPDPRDYKYRWDQKNNDWEYIDEDINFLPNVLKALKSLIPNEASEV